MSTRTDEVEASRAGEVLFVDLDGGLIVTDLLREQLSSPLRRRPWLALRVPFWACGAGRRNARALGELRVMAGHHLGLRPVDVEDDLRLAGLERGEVLAEATSTVTDSLRLMLVRPGST